MRPQNELSVTVMDSLSNNFREENMGSKRYTLLLPDEIHLKLHQVAENRGMSVRETVIKSLKIGVLALEFEKTPEKEIIFQEYTKDGNTKEIKTLIL
jgi:hypothetical protein